MYYTRSCQLRILPPVQRNVVLVVFYIIIQQTDAFSLVSGGLSVTGKLLSALHVPHDNTYDWLFAIFVLIVV